MFQFFRSSMHLVPLFFRNRQRKLAANQRESDEVLIRMFSSRRPRFKYPVTKPFLIHVREIRGYAFLICAISGNLRRLPFPKS
jgi:hypothetical protein